jgi:hypothetical protein
MGMTDLKASKPGSLVMKDHRATGAAAMSLAASYAYYFGNRAPFMEWWRRINDALEDQGRDGILYGAARAGWLEGLTIDQAVKRQLENLDSSQEERSYYDV